MQGTNQASHILPDLSKENARENEMRRAVNRGYVKEFKLDTPWHPFPFLTGRLMTFPFQHKEAFMYHGTFKSIFFKRGEKPEDAGVAARGGQEDTSWKLCNPASIITQGAYWKRNIYGSEDKMGWDNRYGEDITHADKGIFLWAKPGVVGDITFELKVPTEDLVSTHGDRVDNTRKMFELYESPRNWREQLIGARASKDPSNPNEFIYKSELPISRITGVMPREQGGLITGFGNSNKHKDEIPEIEILPLDEYVEKLIQEEGIDKIQNNSQVNEVRKKAEYEYRRMQEVQDIFDSEDIFDPMNDACEAVLSIIALKTRKNPLKNRSFSEPSNWLVEIIQENKHQDSRGKAIHQFYDHLTEDLKDYNRRVDEIFQYLPEEPDSMWIDNIDQLEKWHLRVLHKNQNFSRAKEDVNKLLKKQHEVLKRDDLEEERELMNLKKRYWMKLKNQLLK